MIDFEDVKSINKYVKKVKFFWRGINFNYPYTFVKLVSKEDMDGEKSVLNGDSENRFYKVQEFSKKKINPSESFYTNN